MKFCSAGSIRIKLDKWVVYLIHIDQLNMDCDTEFQFTRILIQYLPVIFVASFVYVCVMCLFLLGNSNSPVLTCLEICLPYQMAVGTYFHPFSDWS